MSDHERHQPSDPVLSDTDIEMQRTATHTGHAPEVAPPLPDPGDPQNDPAPPASTARWVFIVAAIILLVVLVFIVW
jgi:uncharacterized integral membrane protein